MRCARATRRRVWHIPPDGRRLAAAVGLSCVLVVVLASAAIRLNSRAGLLLPFLDASQVGALRVLHRAAASLEVVAAAWIAWQAWRRRAEQGTPAMAAGLLAALTVLLSVIGIVGGRGPAPLMALGNVLGGLALAAAFAWLLGLLSPLATRIATPLALAALLAVQAIVGARLSVFGHAAPVALPAHIFLGLAIAVWLARAGRRLVILGIVAAASGFTALQYEYSAALALAHAAFAALLIAVAAGLRARIA